MVVKVLIKREIQEGKAREVFALLNEFRSGAMNQKGYISGETLFDYDNPNEILVIGMWRSAENWLNWKENPERKANERQIEGYLEKPTEYKTYVMGTFYTQFAKKQR